METSQEMLHETDQAIASDIVRFAQARTCFATFSDIVLRGSDPVSKQRFFEGRHRHRGKR